MPLFSVTVQCVLSIISVLLAMINCVRICGNDTDQGVYVMYEFIFYNLKCLFYLCKGFKVVWKIIQI